MFNPVTDRLGYVEKVVIEGRAILGQIPLRLFGRVVPVTEGVSQEIFRGGQRIGSIRPPGITSGNAEDMISAPIKVRKGDVIYRVSLVPQPYNFVGTIQTKDGYQRIYDMHIELVVSNSVLFIFWYCQGNDPANSVISQFKEDFQIYASKFDHDKLDSLRPVYNNFNNWSSNHYGMKVTNPQHGFRKDEKRVKALEIQQNAELRKREIEAEAEIKALEEKFRMARERRQKEFDREEKKNQSDFARAQRLQHHLNEARIKLLNKTVDDLVSINSARIRDALDYGGSIKMILEASLKPLNVFSAPSREDGDIVDAPPLQGDIPGEAEEKDNGPDTIIDPPLSLDTETMSNSDQTSTSHPLPPTTE